MMRSSSRRLKTAIEREADEAPLLGRCRWKEDRPEYAAGFQGVAQRRRLPNVAGLERDDLRLGGLDVVAELVETRLQVGVIGVQAGPAPFLVLEDVEHGVEARDLVLHYGRAEDGGQRLVAEVLGVAPRAGDEAAAAGNRFRQADGAEMHALGEAGGGDEAGAAGALRAERVRLIDDERRTVALANLDEAP